jgi:isocitrate/isopropylmalate dehydrogenase
MLSGVLMLRHLGHPDVAGRVETAIRDVIAEGAATTPDLGGSGTTSGFADAVIARLETPVSIG